MSEEAVKAKSSDEHRKAFKPDREAIKVAGQVVFIAELSGEEALTLAPGDDYAYRLVARTLVDKEGRRLYSDSKEDLTEIKSWGQRKLRPMIAAAIRLNGIGEETEKNSDAGPSAG